MRLFLSAVALLLALSIPAFSQSQGTSARATNAVLFGVPTIATRLLATNTAGTNHFAGTLNVRSNIASQGRFHGDGGGLTNLPTTSLAKANASELQSYNVPWWGDSITRGTVALPFSPTYYLSLAYPGINVFNGGFDGYESGPILTEFLVDSNKWDGFNIFMMGRNDIGNGTPLATTLNNISNAVYRLPEPKRFVVLSIINSQSWSNGTAFHAATTNMSAAFSAAYPSNYFDMRGYLISQFSAGIPQDVIDHNRDVPPTSLMNTDTIHPNAAGNAVMGNRMVGVITNILNQTDKPIFYSGLPGLLRRVGKITIVDALATTLTFPPTTNASIGVVNVGTERFMHNYSSLGLAGYNGFVGQSAGNFTMTGVRNLGAGAFSLFYNTSGSDLTANGYASGFGNTTGNRNTYSGHESGNGNSVGSDNTADGDKTLKNNTGSGNTATGSSSQTTKTTGDFNTSAGYFNDPSSGTGGSYFGAFAGHGSGDYNTMLGVYQGFGMTTGSRNVFVGPATIEESYSQSTNGNRNISIGNDVAVASASASDQLNIGNLIYGTALDGTGTTISSGKIGIGIKAPAYKFDVLGTVNASTNISSQGVFHGDGSGLTNIAGATLTPPGSNTQVIFNNAGAFGADAGLTYDADNDVLSTLGVPILRVREAQRSYFLAGSGNLTGTGSNNDGIGFNALNALTTGLNNNAFGSYAGASLTSGFGNTFFGVSAGRYNITGFDNTAIGTSAMPNNQSHSSVAIGKFNMFMNTNGFDNTSVGVEAMYGNIHDDQINDSDFPLGTTNWFFGTGWVSAAGKASKNSDGTGTLITWPYIDYGVGAVYRIVYTVLDYTVGTVTVSFGGVSDTPRSANGTYTWDAAPISYASTSGVLTFTPSSTSRLAIDDVTLTCISASSATYNAAYGVGALYMATTAYENSAFGLGAMRQTTSGGRNVAHGTGALGWNGPGNTNTAIGAYAFGRANNMNGGVAIGNEAGFWETANYKLFIDNTRRADQADGRVKSLVYGVFDPNPSDQIFTVNASRNSFVSHNGRYGSIFLDQYSADGYYPIIELRTSRNNTVPTVTTTVNNAELGKIRFSGVNTGNAFRDVAGMYVVQVGTSGATYVPGNLSLYTSTSSGQNLNHLVLETGGQVGIGTSTPASTLDVVGDIRASTTIYATGNVASVSGTINGNASGVSNAVTLLAGNCITLSNGPDGRTITISAGSSGVDFLTNNRAGATLSGLTLTNNAFVAGYAALTNGVLWQGGAQLTNIYTATATLDFGNIATIGCGDLTMTVTGAAVGDVVDLGVPNASIVANSSYSAWVSATDTVTVRFCALISGDPASGVFRAEVHKWK